MSTSADLRPFLAEHLARNGVDVRKPFRCLNPAHPDVHPSMSYDTARHRAHCFSCGSDYDLFDVIMLERGCDFAAAFRAANEEYGDGSYIYSNAPVSQKNTNYNKQPIPLTDDSTAFEGYAGIHTGIGDASMNAYIEAAATRAGETDYFARRGLSEETVARYRLGYDPAFHTRGEDGFAEWQAAVVPTADGCYMVRNIDPHAGKGDRIRKRGDSQLFHTHPWPPEQPVFVVEGEFDALSVAEAGYAAVSLGSVSNVQKFLTLCRAQPPKALLLLMLDRDGEGERAQAALQEGLMGLRLPAFPAAVLDDAKDANEALIRDRAAFCTRLEDALLNCERQAEEAQAAVVAAYRQTSLKGRIAAFTNGITDSVNTPALPTGFKQLDEQLDGGLYEGLYIIGAISSLGKTTFVLQMAEQIAMNGTDVLIFSLEMAANELIAKGISRQTLRLTSETSLAKTARGITDGKRYVGYSQKEHQLIADALEVYMGFSNHLFVFEGQGNMGAEQVREAVARHVEITKTRPVVVVDYLQLLAPYDVRASDKQNTDRAVLELKRLSRDFKLSVLAISSFNRQSYNQPVTMEAFKESGAIEYSSDVLIGLQAQGAGKAGFDVNEAKRQYPREVELVILKNRNGATGGELKFRYYALFNDFRE